MFTPTAEKLIPDLTPREELVVLARALWREGYNDHLAGHITVNLGDGTLLCNPWLLTWEELRPSQVLRIDLEGRVRRGRLAGPARHPAAPRAAQAARGHQVGGAQPPALRHGLGRPGRAAADPRPELRARRRDAGRGRRVRGPGERRLQRAAGGGADGRRRPWRSWPATASSCWAARPAPCTSGRWRWSSAASTPGTSGRPAAAGVSRLPQAFLDLVARSDGEGFIGFWEAAVRAELAADPDLLDG